MAVTDWPTWGIRAGITAVAVPAAVSSFIFQTALARVCGWGQAAPLYPFCIDALGATALLVYRAHRHRYAQAVMAIAAAGTVMSNSFGHLYTQPDATTAQRIAVTVVGAVPAISLILLGHLAATTRPATSGAATTTYNETAQTLQATPQPATSVIPVAQPQPPDDLAALIRRTWPDGQYPGLQKMARQLGVGVPRVRAAKAALNGHEDQP